MRRYRSCEDPLGYLMSYYDGDSESLWPLTAALIEWACFFITNCFCSCLAIEYVEGRIYLVTGPPLLPYQSARSRYSGNPSFQLLLSGNSSRRAFLLSLGTFSAILNKVWIPFSYIGNRLNMSRMSLGITC